MHLVLVAIFAAAASAGALAQAQLWSQCGGVGWPGPITCVAGATCKYVDPYFSVCVPTKGAASSTKGVPTTVIPTLPTNTPVT
ncbi:hypothetical protein FRC08_006215 [Ceratobasidium sp. 394]|nr:hypothetical protein FRC08_006215 [Ceratobasidium sp. 394]